MKYLRLNIQLLFAFVLMLGLFSCTDEDAVDNGKKEIKEGLPTTVTLKLTSATPMVVETKTEDSNSKFGMINDLAILVYKAETRELDKVTYVSGVNAKEWNGSFNATTGSRRVYVLANSGLGEAGIKSDYSQESDLLTSGLIDAGATTPVGNEQMLGFVHTSDDFGKELSSAENSTTIKIPESNGSTSVVSLFSRLYPPYSKITFTVKNEVKTDMSEKVQLNITNVYVRNLPTKYSLLPIENILQTSGTSGTDVYSEKVEKRSEGEDAYVFYMYENLQGTINEGNGDPKLKSPFKGEYPSNNSNPSENYESWNTKWATQTPCTYIEVEGTYAIWKSNTQYGAGKIHYRFFLGANTVDNFDIKRNTHYKVELAFTGVAGYDELSYEWRVNAQLNDVTIIPEGDLEIDGSPDYYFPFVIINASDENFSMTVENRGSAVMNLLFYDKNYNDWYDAGSDISNVPEHRSFLEYKIRANTMGIMGADGITFIDDDGNSYNGNYGYNDTQRDKVRDGSIYVQRIYTVKVTPSFEYTVKMYPLLCLTSETSIIRKGAVYAQRFDRNEGLVNKSTMERLCDGQTNGAGVLQTLPPRVTDLESMIKYETFEPFRPKTEGPYWTENGLYYWRSGKLEKAPENVTKGYVRCTYR